MLITSRLNFGAMNANENLIDDASKIKILRRLIEAVMWEWNAVKEGRWEELPDRTSTKREVVQEMQAYDWGSVPIERENPEVLILRSQIMDLEYQLKKMLENKMNLIATQLNDLERRHSSWKKMVRPYRLAAALN